MEDRNWYVAWTKGRHEKIASLKMREQGLEHFLPLVSRTRQWSDRKKQILFPLFPSYVFVKSVLQELYLFRRIEGVARILGLGNGPISVPEEEVLAVKRAIESGRPSDLYPALPAGSKVRICRGVLTGLTGTLVEWRDTTCVVLSVNLIQQGAAVEISPDEIEPL